MSDINLDEPQRAAVEKLRNGSILNGGVGSGKTRTALTYFYEKVCGGTVGDYGSLVAPRDLYIITTAKKRDDGDWQNYANLFGLSDNEETSAGAIQVTVDSWNKIHHYDKVQNAFFIFDEQRLVGSGAWTRSFLRIAKQNGWILLSATPGDTWLDYIPVFVANGFYKNRTAFKAEHVVYNNYAKFPKVDRYVGVGKLVRNKNAVLVDLPYEKQTVRQFSEVLCKYDEELYRKVQEKRWHVYEERPLRDSAEMVSVMRKVVNSDESRLTELLGILSRHSKVIVFYNFDYELEMLRGLAASSLTDSTSLLSDCMGSETCDGGPEKTKTTSSEEKTECQIQSTTDSSKSSLSETNPEWNSTSAGTSTHSPEDHSDTSETQSTFSLAEWNGHKHEPIPETARWVYLVQYAAGSEGWNCVETDAMVFFSFTYSYKMFEQAQGRIDRRNTPFRVLKYYVFRSNSSIDKAIKSNLSVKKSFNERKFWEELEQIGA